MTQQFNPKDFESKWREMWEKENIYKTPEDFDSTNKYYCLDMYPYPSGSGLHVGHPKGYLGSDVVSRFMRMKGKKVMHPFGFDSFGLPAENFAIKSGVHPQITTEKAIEMFRSQLENLGLSYDWSRELASHRPDYYKWTQWLFLQFYKKGLAYKKKAPVNWCPFDNTVLANEQIINGRCERCENEVVQKDMEQWFFKITEYAEELLNDLDKIDWPESTKLGQKNWIGKSEGTKLKFKVGNINDSVEVFTTRIDTIFGATFLAIAPEHKVITENSSAITNINEVKKYIEESKKKTELDRQSQKEKTGIKVEGIIAVNPISGEKIPVFVADYVLPSYGTGAIMGVPGHDERDNEFAKKYNIEIRKVISSTDEKITTEYGELINSGEYSGQTSQEAIENLQKYLEQKEIGKKEITYRLRDWLLSRQRYWGCPIPIVYDPEGNAHPVDESDLPVLLPTDVDFKPTGESPLNYSEEFHKSAEEKYGKGWRREVDTMDTFVDSSWYFFRFTDPHNQEEFASKEAMNSWMPVDLYVGGAEHTVLHLLYARFFTKVLRDLGYLDFDEPFQKLRHQGMIAGPDGRKMSKRWGNVINPDDEVEKFGADTLRVYEMFMGPFEDGLPWSTETEIGVFRFISKIWNQQDKVDSNFNSDEQEVWINKLIKKVSEDIQDTKFNTAIAKMMEFINFINKEEKISKSVWEKFLLVIAPFAPYISEELWEKLGNKFSIHQQEWPKIDESKIIEESVSIAIQVNGKLRDKIKVSLDSEEKEVKEIAMKSDIIKKYVIEEPKRVIFVKNRIINFIV